jgi:hypothetical protein
MKKLLSLGFFFDIIFISISLTAHAAFTIDISTIDDSEEFQDWYYESDSFTKDKFISTNHRANIEDSSNTIMTILEQINIDLTSDFIREITAFGPRRTTSQACKEAGQYIYQELKNLDLEVNYYNWSMSSSTYGSNIEAILPGVDPLSEEIFIVCAHYDSVSQSPGADDNAGGTSAVLTAATILSQYSFNNTIRFVTFDGEEQGLHGSRYYAQYLNENSEPVKAVLNLDMIGYASNSDSESKVNVFYNEPSIWLTDFTDNISESYKEAINLDVVKGGYSGGSDHVSFYGVGINAIAYSEYEFNPNYHTSRDTFDKMNPHYFTNITKLMVGTLIELAEYVPQQEPNQPSQPNGPVNGRINVESYYETSVIDPNADQIYLMWDWGDGSLSEWLGPYNSGEQITTSHLWSKVGNFEIKVRAKDIFEQQSEWSDPLSISMSKTKYNQNIFTLFLEKHPNLFLIIRQLLKQ